MSADSDFYAQRMSHRCQRAEQLEREAAEAETHFEIAREVAGPEAIRTDGSGDPEEGHDAVDFPPLHVGDQVSIRDEDGPDVPIVRVCSRTAGEYDLEFCDETVAEYNDVDVDEDVYHITFVNRTTKDIDRPKAYPYPRSRLKLESALHGDDEEGEQ